MQTLRDDEERMQLAGLACQWGIDINGTRYAITAGAYTDHLLRTGDVKTLCGLRHTEVITTTEATPACRRCLKLVGGTLTPTAPNGRLKLIATLAADTIAE